jgi:probable F420-dependent oxidoreductase
MLLAQRDPIVTAKAIASLDVLSGGRVLLGIGAGWNIEEMEDHGVDPERRFGRMRESVEAMRALWREDEASFAGEQIAFAPAWSWPKPVQPGGPPVLVGGNGKRVLERVVRYGDAWYPNFLGDDDRMLARLEKLRLLAAEQGRDPIPTTLQIAPLEPDRLARFEAAGVTRVLRYVSSAAPDVVERELDEYAAAAVEYRTAGA